MASVPPLQLLSDLLYFSTHCSSKWTSKRAQTGICQESSCKRARPPSPGKPLPKGKCSRVRRNRRGATAQPFTVQSTAATVGTLRLMNSQAPEAKTSLGKYPVFRTTIHSGYLAKPQTHLTCKRDLDVYCVDRSAGLLKHWKRVSTRIHQIYHATSARATLCLVHNILQTCAHDRTASRQSK